FLVAPGAALADLFRLGGPAEAAPRYNIAPSQPVPAVRAAGGGRELARPRRGLIPPRSRGGQLGPISAPAETAAEKPALRHALRRRRCLIPAPGFFEWQAAAGGKHKQPFCIRLAEDGPFAFAGLWERWQGPDGPVESCAILTTAANGLVRPIHERMPVILGRRDFDQWLDPSEEGAAAMAPLLVPYPAGGVRGYAG